MNHLKISPGYPLPLGTSFRDGGVNFSIFAGESSAVSLHLFNFDTNKPYAEIQLDYDHHRTGQVWHVLVHELPETIDYAYQVNNNPLLLLDPYARAVNTSKDWIKPMRCPYTPLGVVSTRQVFDWGDVKKPATPMQDLVIYEMHVRGFTIDPTSHVQNRGKFLGIIEKIPYLLELGVNAIELLPINEFNEGEYDGVNPLNNRRLCNYWGYSPVNFFASMNRYVVHDPLQDFKTMVKELHRAGIEIILDVVFNHTAEGNEIGPTLTFRGLANDVYYMMTPNGHYHNFTGCGNTLNVNHPTVREMIIKCLRYWVTDMHVDGFRFDLASIFTRDTDGTPLDKAPLSDALSRDPILSETKLIAEPWDAVGLYHVGRFYPQEDRWSEWNGRYRDMVRRFIKGTPGYKGKFATRICGSQDIYPTSTPLSTINFVTAHDGFSLADLVSYNKKHNEANGEDNRDGSNENDSWNCGVEGPTHDPKILKLRQNQMRNFHLALMISIGTPMLVMGDEYAHTKNGNNNTWCQDNELNWFQWNKLKENAGFYRFYKMINHLRKNHALLRRDTFLSEHDIKWHHPNWYNEDQLVAYTLVDNENGEDLFIAFNAKDTEEQIILPGKRWRKIVDTAEESPKDIVEEKDAEVVKDQIVLKPFSALLLKKVI